jgi:hypothetical protein
MKSFKYGVLACLSWSVFALSSQLSAHEKSHHDHAHEHEAHQHDAHDHDHDGHRHHGAHVHGMATFDVVIDDKHIMVQLKSPLMNFLGFERQPRGAEEQAAFDSMMQQLENAETVMQVVGTSCQLDDVVIESPFDNAGDDAHYDIDASYFFTCESTEKVQSLNINLFEFFPGHETVQVQAVLPTGQQQAELTPQQNTLRVR